MIYFSDYFKVPTEALKNYGAFDISLVTDLPLFIDPFLLFGSAKTEYQQLHDEIIQYLIFLKGKSELGGISEGEKKAWFMFPEVEQTWLGFSVMGNSGRGLGPKFASSLSLNMPIIFPDLGDEKISQASHLEKAGLFQIGIGKDNISDFTTNLIKAFLLAYTEQFTKVNVDPQYHVIYNVEKVYFNYDLERWMPQKYTLPSCNGNFVLLTPMDILTKDENWINSGDMRGQFTQVCNAIPNSQLRGEINNYFRSKLPKVSKSHPKVTQKEKNEAIIDTLKKFPKIVDYYIRLKERDKDGARVMSKKNVEEIKSLFVSGVSKLLEAIAANTDFKKIKPKDSFEESMERVRFLKHVIEKNDGYRIFYVKGLPVKREEHLQLIFRLTWYATSFDVNSEVNNGRGPVDYKISKGSADAALVEFKLASNSQLKRNLMNQVKIYQEANPASRSIKVILYFSLDELQGVKLILKELKLLNDETIVLIDARRDNKKSGSKA